MTFLDILMYLLVFIASTFLIIYLYCQYAYIYWKVRGIPFLKPLFPYGNLRSLTLKKLCLGEQIADIYKEIKVFSKSFGGFFFLSRPIFMPIDLELIKTIITKDFNYFQDRGFHSNAEVDPLGVHVVTLRGPRWKRIRGKISPSFTSSKIKMMFQTMLDCSEELDNIIGKYTKSQEPFDIGDIVGRFILDNIGSCAFGIDCNTLKNPNTEFQKYVNLFLDTTFSDVSSNAIGLVCPYILDLFKISLTNKQVTKFFLELFKETINFREKTKMFRRDFLDLFIKLKNEEHVDDEGKHKKNEDALTFIEVAAQSFSIMIGGYETSSTTLCFCLFEIALHQNVQNEIKAEIVTVLNKHGGEITYEAIMEMKYMDKVIYETLRKYPAISILARECVQDYTIPGTDKVIKKGVACWTSILSIHMDPEIYPDPERFDPERFSQEERAKRHPCAYLPFGDGPRVCIGMRFAMIQMKICLTKLLRRNEYHLDSKTTIPVGLNRKGIFLSPNTTIWLNTKNS